MVNYFETIFESKIWIFIPNFHFLKCIFNPIKLFIIVNFGCVLIADEREESFIVDDIETFEFVHGIEHILFFNFSKLCNFVKVWIPLLFCNETVVIDIDSSKDIIKTDFLFNRSFTKAIEQIGQREIINLWDLFGLNFGFVCFYVLLSYNIIFIDINFFNMWQNRWLWIFFKQLSLQITSKLNHWNWKFKWNFRFF